MSHSHQPLRTFKGVVEYTQRLFAAAKSDEELLEEFVTRHEQAAFAVLMHRHGPMVLRICRRVLGDRHSAEDALQGTFLILARQAASIRRRASLASWLHGTALRVAANVRRSMRRASRLPTAPGTVRTELGPVLSASWQEVQAIVDEEVQALPEIYREAFVRCCLEQASTAEVARQLGVEEPTVRNRLSRARKRLQGRLDRRGISLSAVGAVIAVTSGEVAARPGSALIDSTADAAASLARGRDIASLAVPQSVVALVTGASQTMLFVKLKMLLCVLVIGTVGLFGVAVGQPQVEPKSKQSPPSNPRVEPQTSPAVKAELERLEGVWVVSELDEHDTFFYVFSGDKCTIVNATKKEAHEYRVDLDPAKSPKWLDLSSRATSTPWLSIYELKGDTLRMASQLEVVRAGPNGAPLATRSARPAQFKAVDSSVRVSNLKRITARTAEAFDYPIVTMPKTPRHDVPYVEPKKEAPQSAPPANDDEVQVLEAQMKVKRAHVKAAEVRVASAKDRVKLISGTPLGTAEELLKAKSEVAAAEANLEVGEAEVGEIQVKIQIARKRLAESEGRKKLTDWLRKSNPAVNDPPKRPEPKPDSPPVGAQPILEYQKALGETPVRRVYWIQSRAATIAVSVEPEIRKASKRFDVYVSVDEEKSWQLAGELPRDVRSFRFEAPRDGRYSFNLRRIKTDGGQEPADPKEMPAQLRLYVETEQLAVPEANAKPELSAIDQSTAVVTSFQRYLRIPVAVDPAKRKEVKELQLFVSVDEGKTWKLTSKISPDAEAFEYEATRDGMHCFSMRVAKTDGSMEPPEFLSLPIVIRYQVVTEKPPLLPEGPPPAIRLPVTSPDDPNKPIPEKQFDPKIFSFFLGFFN